MLRQDRPQPEHVLTGFLEIPNERSIDEALFCLVANRRNGKQALEEALSESTKMELPDLNEFIAARDFLLKAHDYKEAKAGFVWPKLVDFNRARDYFDTLADHCAHPALIYVDDKETEKKVSYQELKDRSNRAANFLQDLGLGKRDVVQYFQVHTREGSSLQTPENHTVYRRITENREWKDQAQRSQKNRIRVQKQKHEVQERIL